MDLLIKLFNASISASFLVLAVIAFRLIFRKAPKAITVFLWALVAIRLICPVSFESSLSLIPNAETIPTEILSVDPHKGINSTSFEVIENPIYTDFIDSDVTVDSIDSFQWDVVYLTYGWLMGMGIMVLYSIISYLRIYLKIRQSMPLRANIFICDTINTPFIFGIVRPRIYLPSSMGEEDMSYVIAHEKAHLKRRDYLWKPLGFLLLTVYWFNPVLWLAYVLLCRDIELACDERVIKEMGAEIKKPYSMALINCSVPRRMISACPVAFGEVGVKKRIKAVLNYKKPAFWVIAAAVIASIAVAVCFMTNPKSESTEEYEWYCNPTHSAVGYGILAFYPDNGYKLVSVEATDGEAFLDDRYYNYPGEEKYAGWSPDYRNYTETKGADITITATKNDEEKVFTVRVTRSEKEDESGIGVYFTVRGLDCGIEEDGWARFTLKEEKTVKISAELDTAVSKAILSSNAIKDWHGECATEGHVILGTDKKGDKIKVYLLEQYSVFGFQNGWFLDQSGYSTSAVMTFEETETGYKYLEVEHPRDGSFHGDDIKAMFPKTYQKRALSPTDKDRESMWAQKVAYAESYLKEIGREAKIGTYGDIEHILLTDVGVSVEVSNAVINLPFDYNTGEIGYSERLENGTRYIYRTSYLADKNIILYTKEVYGENRIVERVEVDSLTGNIVAAFNSPEYMTYFDAKVLDVEKNGDFVLVEPFENTNERKTADRIWVSLNVSSEVPAPDVYEGLYIRIMYDGMIEESYPAKIPNVSAIYLYADVNYIGNEAAPSENKEPTTEAYYAEDTTSPLISVGDSEDYYYIFQSDTGDVSTLTLSPTGKRFSFTLSICSSYLPMGTYEEDDKYVILKTDDGKNKYTFEKDKGDLIFVAEKSSPVPKYKYNGANTETIPCIPDKAKYGFADILDAYYDKITADIDNDGVAEECTLGFGPTSGLLTFTFSAYENGMEEYSNIFLEMGSEVYWEFEKGADGKVRVVSKSDEYGSVVRKYDIKIKDGDIELVSKDKVMSHFGKEPESEEFKGLKSDFEALKNFAFSYYTENKTVDGDETTLQLADGKLKKLDDLKTTTVEIPEILEKSVAAVDNAGYDWIDIADNYVVFWSDELSTYGIMFSESPTKAIRAIKKDSYTGMDSKKIEKYWYEVGVLYG